MKKSPTTAIVSLYIKNDLQSALRNCKKTEKKK